MINRPKWVTEHLPEELATSKLFRFEVKLPGQDITVDLFQDIDIDYDDLENQLERTPAQYMYWASIYSELRGIVAVFERKIRARRGVLTQEIIDEARKEEVKITDKQVASIVDKDEQLLKLEENFDTVQKNTGKVYHMLEAIKMKSEQMRSLAGFKRQEREQTK